VPAFTATLTAPGPIQVTSPVCASASCGSISKSTGLSVGWTGGAGETVMVRVGSGASVVTCRASGASGSLQVPAAALASLALGQGALTIGSSSQSTVQAGAFPVTVIAIDGLAGAATIAP
jgi:hypothetical protein